MGEIDPSLPHYEVRCRLAKHKPGPAFDKWFAKLLGLPVGPAYSTDLNAVVAAINELGWWWHLSHLEAVVMPTTPAPGLEGLVNNGSAYDREGRPIQYRAGHGRGNIAMALCEAWVKAAFDLPAAFVVNASAREEAWAKKPPSTRYMMAYYKARERHRIEAIERFNKEHPELAERNRPRWWQFWRWQDTRP